MKTNGLKVKHENSNFGLFLMMNNIKFTFSYGEFLIVDGCKEEIFRDWLFNKGFERAYDIMIEPVEISQEAMSIFYL